MPAEKCQGCFEMMEGYGILKGRMKEVGLEVVLEGWV